MINFNWIIVYHKGTQGGLKGTKRGMYGDARGTQGRAEGIEGDARGTRRAGWQGGRPGRTIRVIDLSWIDARRKTKKKTRKHRF